MFYRLAGFSFIVLTTFSGLWWCALPVLAVYLFKYDAYELVVSAIILDAAMGAFSTVPYYSVVTICVVVFVQWCKPRLLLYT